MHIRRIACWLLGAWIGGSLFMFVVATQNFRSVDRLLADPSASAVEHIDKLGKEPARMLLRYHVSEQNRWYFERWEKVQIALGALLVALALGSLRGRLAPGIALGLLCIVIAERLFLTPEIVRLGRLLDFVSPAASLPERAQFWRLHGGYSALEMLKLVLAAVLTGQLIVKGRRRSGQIDLVDESDHRHVDR